jgi:hypothetical protein
MPRSSVRPDLEKSERPGPRTTPAFFRCESGRRRPGPTEPQAGQSAPSATDAWGKLKRTATLPERIPPSARRTDAQASPMQVHRRQGILSLRPGLVPTSPPCRHQEDAPTVRANESNRARAHATAATRKTASPRPSDTLPTQNHEGIPAALTPSCARPRPASAPLLLLPPACRPALERSPQRVHSGQLRLHQLYRSSRIPLIAHTPKPPLLA